MSAFLMDADAATQYFLLGHSDITADMDVMGAAIARSQGHDPVVFYSGLTMNNVPQRLRKIHIAFDTQRFDAAQFGGGLY